MLYTVTWNDSRQPHVLSAMRVELLPARSPLNGPWMVFTTGTDADYYNEEPSKRQRRFEVFRCRAIDVAELHEDVGPP